MWIFQFVIFKCGTLYGRSCRRRPRKVWHNLRILKCSNGCPSRQRCVAVYPLCLLIKRDVLTVRKINHEMENLIKDLILKSARSCLFNSNKFSKRSNFSCVRPFFVSWLPLLTSRPWQKTAKVKSLNYRTQHYFLGVTAVYYLFPTNRILLYYQVSRFLYCGWNAMEIR